MFDRLIDLSLRHRAVVLLLALALLLWGGQRAISLPVDVFPNLNRPTVTVLTESGGLSPEEVEAQVTRPIELAMSGAPGVERVRSQSAPGLSVVWVEFDWEGDIWRHRQQVTERLSAVAEELPREARPSLGPVTSIMGEILLVGLSAPDGTLDGPALRAMADTTFRPRLLAVPGVSQVVVLGGGQAQLSVSVHPDRLADRAIPLSAVTEAAALAQGVSAGGFVERKSQEYLVRNLARSVDPTVIGETVVAIREGATIRLADVADVHLGVAPMRGMAGVNGAPGVILGVHKQPGADTLRLDADLTEALDALSHGTVPSLRVTPLFRQARFIEAAVDNVEEALRDGAILVAVVLFAFLLNLRTTAITLVAIPLSFVVAALCLDAMGLGINTMTLGGLAVAIGELVDDAIVDVENVLRRLRENRARPDPRPTLAVVFDASREVRSSIVFSTVLIVLVFLPLFALSGIEGRLFAPLGVAYITSILASLVVSLTVTPALASLLLPGLVARQPAAEGALVRRLKALDARLLGAALVQPRRVLGGTLLLVVLAAASLPFLERRFLPDLNEGTLTLTLVGDPGISLTESDRLGRIAEQQLLTLPEVRSVGRRTGRAELDEHAEGVHFTEIDVDLLPGERPREATLAEIRARLGRLPGLQLSLGQPISHRLDHLLSGVRAPLVVKLFGPDTAVLREEALLLSKRLASIRGLVDLNVEAAVLIPQLQVEVDREAAARFALPAGALTELLGVAIGGHTVAEIPDGNRVLPVVVRYAEAWRADPEALGRAPIVLDDGRALTLSQLATIQIGAGPNQILHEDGQPRIALSASTAGRDAQEVVDEVRAQLASTSLPAGYHARVDGQHAQQAEASRQIALLALLALLGMYAALYVHFGDHRLVLQVLLNIPLAMVGAVAALWLSGASLSVATLVGFITLCGIASRNSILMISHYQHLEREEGSPRGVELVVRGSLERLVPVAMTALSAGLGLIPLALASGEPGKEVLGPVAIVVLGGLVSSTLLDMVVTPTVYLHFTGRSVRKGG